MPKVSDTREYTAASTTWLLHRRSEAEAMAGLAWNCSLRCAAAPWVILRRSWVLQRTRIRPQAIAQAEDAVGRACDDDAAGSHREAEDVAAAQAVTALLVPANAAIAALEDAAGCFVVNDAGIHDRRMAWIGCIGRDLPRGEARVRRRRKVVAASSLRRTPPRSVASNT